MSEMSVAEWAENAAAELTTVYGESLGEGALALTVAGGPEGDTELVWSAEGGRVSLADTNAGATVSATIKYPDFVKVLSGELPPAVAYMQGKLKPAGDMSAVLKLLSTSSDERFEKWRERAIANR